MKTLKWAFFSYTFEKILKRRFFKIFLSKKSLYYRENVKISSFLFLYSYTFKKILKIQFFTFFPFSLYLKNTLRKNVKKNFFLFLGILSRKYWKYEIFKFFFQKHRYTFVKMLKWAFFELKLCFTKFESVHSCINSKASIRSP